MAQAMCKSAKERANRKGIPFNITVDDIVELIGDGVCPVLGIHYNLSSHRITDESASLDRFVPSLGYIKCNCAVMSQLANAIKRNATSEQVRRVADWMAKNGA